MDYSTSHDYRNIQEKFGTKGLVRSHHRPYSPDLSPYNFWFVRLAKGKMRDREFHTVQDILGRLTEIWNGLTFEDVQSVFLEWQTSLN
jgi:hypothetical protein